jgi:hypothetical protein
MTKVTMIIAAGLLAISAPAFAGGKSEAKGNKINAQGMSKTLAGAGSDGVLGFPGGSIARTLGKEGSPYPQGGWGNVGSALTGGVVAKPNPKF